MEHRVKVQFPPNAQQVPEHLHGKLFYDAEHQQLVFRGFMCKSEYDQLLRLSQDLNYQRAATQLFQLSTVSDAPPLRQLGRVLAALTVACFFLAAIVWWALLRSSSSENDDNSSTTNATYALELSHAAQILLTLPRERELFEFTDSQLHSSPGIVRCQAAFLEKESVSSLPD